MTRYCFNPKDPSLRRFVLTEALIEEGLVECPPPGEKIPETMLGGEGGVIDKVTLELSKTLRERMGRVPTEAELKAVTNHLMRLDPKALAAAIPEAVIQNVQQPVQREQGESGPPNGSGGAMDMVTQDNQSSTGDQGPVQDPAPAQTPIEPGPKQTEAKPKPDSGVLHMSDVPIVDIGESQEDAAKRIFGKRMADVSKMDLCNKAIKSLKVQLDMSKQKKDLVRDFQLAEIARKSM